MIGPHLRESIDDERVLHAYLLGRVELESMLAFQRRLVFEVSGERSTGNLVLCEHPEAITVGREGSARHLLLDPEELRQRSCPIRWVNRGGGCLLHVPGQLTGYSILALDRSRITLQEYLDRLHGVIYNILRSLDVPAELRSDHAGVWVGDRLIAHVGIAVRDWVGYFGFTLNVEPDLELFRSIQCDGAPRPMTSMARERRVSIRQGAVRQRILEGFSTLFEFDRVAVFHHHPALSQKVVVHAAVNRTA